MKKGLLISEKWAPTWTSRLWGVWENPLAEFFGWKVTRLTETQVEVAFFARKMGDLISPGEFAISTLWKRQSSKGQRSLTGFSHHCEIFDGFLVGPRGQHLVARTQLLENDLENALRAPEPHQIEHTVLYFNEKNILAARVKFIHKLNESAGIFLLREKK